MSKDYRWSEGIGDTGTPAWTVHIGLQTEVLTHKGIVSGYEPVWGSHMTELSHSFCYLLPGAYGLSNILSIILL